MRTLYRLADRGILKKEDRPPMERKAKAKWAERNAWKTSFS